MKDIAVSMVLCGLLIVGTARCGGGNGGSDGDTGTDTTADTVADSTPDSTPDTAEDTADVMEEDTIADTGSEDVAGDESPASFTICDPAGTCNGQTYADWTVAFWNWAVSIPAATTVFQDGACDQNQTAGSVFFLAGNWGGTSTRTCTVPAGTSIFFPIDNVMAYPCPEVFGSTDCDLVGDTNLLGAVDGMMGTPMDLTLEIDGVAVDPLDSYLVDSIAFDLIYSGTDPSIYFFPADAMGPGVPAADTECTDPWTAGNECSAPVGNRRSATGGYWIMVDFAEAGAHTIHLTGVVNPSSPYFETDVTYDLTIE